MRIWAKRVPAAVAAIAMAFGGVVACSSPELDTTAAGVAGLYASALERQNPAKAATYTTAPAQAGESLAATLAAMKADDIDVEVDKPVQFSDGTASFSLKTTWKWQNKRTFTSVTSGNARHLSSGWRVTWDPDLIYSGLPNGGALRLIRTDATPSPKVRSSSGKTFMYEQQVNDLILDPAKTRNVVSSTNALATMLEPIAPLITADVIAEKLAAAPGKPIVAVTLRDTDMGLLAGAPDTIAGVSARNYGKLVMADRRLSSPLEVGLTNYWQAIRDATSGWQVQMTAPGSSPRKLVGEQGPAGPDVNTTIDENVQLSLGDAVVEVGQPATMLILDASTGGVLGFAQNSYAAERGINVDSTYPVGATLDPVWESIDAASGSDGQSRGRLLDRSGLGVRFTVPGASALVGVGPTVTAIDYKSDTTAVSKMNMGAFGVALARSRQNAPPVAPYVIKGVPTKVTGGELGEIGSTITEPVLEAMAKTVATGDASDLANAPGLKALVGTNGPQGPGWFLGLQDGKVVVIYTEGEKSGTAALQVAQKYFRIK
ncbi:peptidase [Gordonia pseudamarae]|uniref:NTF2-like N-terminal transpeptidase domain-containing protein n=1 Tax=Gordonia TaxID=2053 RepID=UPI0019A65CC3|nr:MULTISPECIES: NTF2-like N-terminal transpeptidase domain-containing protein [Gordonia]MBD0021982.1 peptidase [Gordonia sp. (in: high G+C Gram-positive bacteria)]QHN24849.1 peptidase [Gordonia pseudamarae]